MNTRPSIRSGLLGRLAIGDDILLTTAARRLARLGGALGLGRKHEISLTFCDNSRMRRINRRWRGVDAPTDVLSFPSESLRPGQMPTNSNLGDIVISLPYARAAARQLQADILCHLDLLLAHGLLHLVGFDHQTDYQHRRMRSLERQILAQLPHHA